MIRRQGHWPRSRPRLLAIASAVVLLSAVACSGVSEFRSSSNAPAAPTTAPAAANARAASQAQAAPVAAGGQAAAVANTSAGAPAAVPAASPAAAQSDSTATADSSAQILDRMVIRTAQLTVEVQNIESALSKAREIAGSAGGFVSASNTHSETADKQDRMVADLTLQVRSDSADSAISQLRALGKVTGENTGSQDVTEEYVDLDSNLRNLQATESAILKLMDRATQIQDVLSLQRELTNVRGQIERIQGRKTYLERRTDMATITLSLRLPPVTPSEPTTGAWDPIATAARGWQASLTVLRGVADVLIVALAFSWWLLPVLAVGAYVWMHRRRPGPSVTVTPESA
jgi:uncharacterized protein DUF4349